MSTAARDTRIVSKDALIALQDARGERDVVITTMSPARDWMTLPQRSLDIVFVPSAMGHATSLGLGIALAQPDRRVVVCNGDGSMLMNLGSLVTIEQPRCARVRQRCVRGHRVAADSGRNGRGLCGRRPRLRISECIRVR